MSAQPANAAPEARKKPQAWSNKAVLHALDSALLTGGRRFTHILQLANMRFATKSGNEHHNPAPGSINASQAGMGKKLEALLVSCVAVLCHEAMEALDGNLPWRVFLSRFNARLDLGASSWSSRSSTICCSFLRLEERWMVRPW